MWSHYEPVKKRTHGKKYKRVINSTYHPHIPTPTFTPAG